MVKLIPVQVGLQASDSYYTAALVIETDPRVPCGGCCPTLCPTHAYTPTNIGTNQKYAKECSVRSGKNAVLFSAR